MDGATTIRQTLRACAQVRLPRRASDHDIADRQLGNVRNDDTREPWVRLLDEAKQDCIRGRNGTGRQWNRQGGIARPRGCAASAGGNARSHPSSIGTHDVLPLAGRSPAAQAFAATRAMRRKPSCAFVKLAGTLAGPTGVH